jgi:hypothetical protein
MACLFVLVLEIGNRHRNRNRRWDSRAPVDEVDEMDGMDGMDGADPHAKLPDAKVPGGRFSSLLACDSRRNLIKITICEPPEKGSTRP